MDRNSSIAVFDSGAGGLTVLDSLKKRLPNESFIYFADTINVPYGNLSQKVIYCYTESAIRCLQKQDIKALVLACNTVTSTCVKQLRENFELIIVGLEPAIKPAIENANGEKVLVLCTKATAQRLKHSNTYSNVAFWSLKTLASDIEHNIFDKQYLLKQVQCLKKKIERMGVKHIVLGCSHYILIKEQFEQIFPKVTFYDGNEGISRRLQQVLEERGMSAERKKPGGIKVFNTENSIFIRNKYIKILKELKNI